MAPTPSYLLTRRRGFSLLSITGAAAIAPALRLAVGESMPLSERFPGWPDHWRGQTLRRIKLGDVEGAFVRDFNGPAALFDCGPGRVLLRYTERPTRRLRGALDSLRRDDWKVADLGPHVDGMGAAWASYRADKRWQRILVRECVFDQRGRSWSTPGEWYWAALMGSGRGPWWAVVTMEEP
jgi:hypothetical protein